MLPLTEIQPQKNEIYLDYNATTPVLPQAIEAVMHTMQACYGNPSSSHITGIKAKYILESTRNIVRSVIGAASGQIIFTSGATEGIQTAIISALQAAKEKGIKQEKPLLLYGATEHKAVPESLKHWNKILNIGGEVVAIPVDGNGQLDIAFIEENIANSVIICTMAVNNETGVYQDLEVLEKAIRQNNCCAAWMVDCVQALGKIDLNIANTSIDYAPFSGHKLYAPKGVGVLYVREGSSYTPFIAGGGQEEGQRSGTENLPGIAALQAIFTLLDDKNDNTFKDHQTLLAYRQQLVDTLCEAFPAIIFNHDFNYSLPTTLNFSVRGLSSKDIMDLFDAAHIRVSSGSACSSKTTGSFVLEAMGKAKWQSESAIRLSFGLATKQDEITQACHAIKQAVEALKHGCLILSDHSDMNEFGVDGLQQWIYDQQCTWCYIDKAQKQCVLIDATAALVNKFETLVHCQGYKVSAVLETHHHSQKVGNTEQIRTLISEYMAHTYCNELGWPSPSQGIVLDDGICVEAITIGSKIMAKLPLGGHTDNGVAYLLGDECNGCLSANNIEYAFTGDTIQIGGLGRTDGDTGNTSAMYLSLQRLNKVISKDTIICPSHDYQMLFSTTLAIEININPLIKRVLSDDINIEEFGIQKTEIDKQLPDLDGHKFCGLISMHSNKIRDLAPNKITEYIANNPDLVIVDVREPYEFEAYPNVYVAGKKPINVPLTQMTNFVHNYKKQKDVDRFVCICRSGNRSSIAARTLTRNGFKHVQHVSGGFALIN